MAPTPPPPEPIEPPVWEYMLPAGGHPYHGLFRRPSMLVFAGTMNDERNRHDLPNPLLSTEPLFPQLPKPARRNSNPLSRRSSQQSGRSEPRSGWGSSPGSPNRDPSPDEPELPEYAFNDALFRTLPPVPGTEVRPFPLPTPHWVSRGSIESRGVTEDIQHYDGSTYGGPSMQHVTSADLVPWRVTQDWRTRDIRVGGNGVRMRNLKMQGRGARRHIRVMQKKADGRQRQDPGDD